MAVKLYFFDKCGVCEPIRTILAYGGIDFEDVYIPMDGKHVVLPQEIKSNCRWGLVPLVEFEGKTLNQSLAATRYFARRCGLVPEDEFEAALCDEYMDSVKDFTAGFHRIARLKDEAEREQKLNDLIKINKVRYLDKFESILKMNGGNYLVGKNITWADMSLACTFDNFQMVFGVDLTAGTDYPHLRRLREHVLNNVPSVKEFRKNHENTRTKIASN